jgi:hypothetical protein
MTPNVDSGYIFNATVDDYHTNQFIYLGVLEVVDDYYVVSWHVGMSGAISDALLDCSLLASDGIASKSTFLCLESRGNLDCSTCTLH